jgi:hypothetical protein
MDINFNLGKKITMQNELLVLSVPSNEQLAYQQLECPNGHKINLIKLFSKDDKYCPLCQEKFITRDVPTETIGVYHYFVRNKKQEKMEIYSLEPININIYDKINIKEGNEIVIITKHNATFNNGIFVRKADHINKYKKEMIVQRSFLTKELVIQEFMSNRPRINYDWKYVSAWRQAMFLAMVKTGISILTIGAAGIGKSEMALQIKEITDGAYIDTPLTSSVAIIGTAIRDFNGGYHFEGGAIFQAKDNVLIVDEVEKMQDYNYLRQINGILANHNFTYRKANIFYEDPKFYVSFIGSGNPRTRNANFNGIPKYIIDNTFMQNPEFLSRMHLIFAFKNKGMITDEMKPKVNIEGLRGFVNYAKSIVVKQPDEFILKKISELVQEYASKTNDIRAYAKVLELCEAEAKLNLSDRITEREVNEIRELLNISQELLYEK